MLRTELLRLAAAAVIASLFIGILTPVNASENSFRPDDEDLYFSALTEEIVEEVKTTEVYSGDFRVNASCRGEIVYDNVSYVFNTLEAGNVYYVKTLVSNGQWVKRGDPIMEVGTVVENADIEALQAQIEIAEQNLEEFMDVNKGLLDKYERLALGSGNANDRRIAQLLRERLLKSYQDEYDARVKDIESMTSQLVQAENMSDRLYITAGIEGEVRDLSRFRNGETVRNYAFICSICDTRSFKIHVPGAVSGLGYNMPVTVTQGQTKGAVSIEGRVRTCRNSILAPSLIGNTDIIEITGDMSLFEYGSDVTISYRSIDMKNVPVVKKNAVYHDAKGDYVYVRSDGNSLKRYIMTGGINNELVWIVNGLKAGDTVVIK